MHTFCINVNMYSQVHAYVSSGQATFLFWVISAQTSGHIELKSVDNRSGNYFVQFFKANSCAGLFSASTIVPIDFKIQRYCKYRQKENKHW
jgi:hypothetical protein